MSERYPLSWPEGWKRTKREHRTVAKFAKRSASAAVGNYVPLRQLSVFEATQRIAYELDRLGVPDGDAIISTNLWLRLDGLPRGDQGEPSDPGVAVYWVLKNRKECIAIDRYTRVADNLAAIAATLEALRAIERHGGAEILERAFRGFTVIPERASGKSWRDVLELKGDGVTAEAIKDHFRLLATTKHPDKGGTRDEFEELMWAREAGLLEIGAKQ
jgi:hypothetical protein